MGRLSQAIRIDSPPTRVWRIIEKHLEHPEGPPLESDEPRDIQEERGEALSEQRGGVGTRTRWFYTYKGKPFVWDDIVTDWQPEEKVAWKATSGWEMEDSFALRPEDNGTQLIYDMNYHLPYGPVGWVYGKLILEPRMRRHLIQVLERTKRLCENPIA